MANDLVQRVAESVQDSMDEILANFKPGARITVLVRTPGKPSADFCMTDDDLDEVIMMVHRRKGETPTTSPKSRGDHLRAAGIGRDPENDRVVFLSLSRVPTDDEMRAIHGAISRTPANCPFCTKPTYVLPCSHCGEPDVPDNHF